MDPRREPDGLVVGDVVASRYRLEEIIGHGGMGEVWAAFDRKLGRRVAIKIVAHASADATQRLRFERETVLSKQLVGPSFVEVYDHGVQGTQAYLVMELLEGETLQDRLRRRGTLSLDETVKLVRSLAACLRVAHALQIVHRDLKPGNIFFARSKAGRSGVQALDGSAEVVKLLDFGIAKDAWDQARLTKPGMMLGSAHYMSPEQIRSGKDVDPRSDLFSLGVIIFRAITGTRAFPGDAAQALAHILHDDPPPLRTIDPTLPRALEGFFEKALSKETALRFQTVDELCEALVSAVRDESLPPPSDEGRSVLAAIERLGLSSRPPRPRSVPAPPIHAKAPALPKVTPVTVKAKPPPLPTASSPVPERAELLELPAAPHPPALPRRAPARPPPLPVSRPSAPMVIDVDFSALDTSMAPAPPSAAASASAVARPPAPLRGSVAKRSPVAPPELPAASPRPWLWLAAFVLIVVVTVLLGELVLG